MRHLRFRHLDLHIDTPNHRSGNPVVVDGHNLTIPSVVAAARHGARVALDDSHVVKSRMAKAENAIEDKLRTGKSVYGISTGFGGSGKLSLDPYADHFTDFSAQPIPVLANT